MVPTDEAIITRQMLYSALTVPATCAAFAIAFSTYTGIGLAPKLDLLQPQPLRSFGKTSTRGCDANSIQREDFQTLAARTN